MSSFRKILQGACLVLAMVVVSASSASAMSQVFYCAADFNRDGEVGDRDKNLILRFYGTRVNSKTRRLDLDNNLVIDSGDLAHVLAAYGPCISCLADINRDGAVDGDDLGFVLSNFGKVSNANARRADLNYDYYVDGADLAEVLGAWGSCSGEVQLGGKS